MRVFIPSALYSYTGGAARVEIDGATVTEIMNALDQRYPGLRFRVIDEQNRVRQHMKLFVNKDPVHDLGRSVGPDDEVYILMALSGGEEWRVANSE